MTKNRALYAAVLGSLALAWAGAGAFGASEAVESEGAKPVSLELPSAGAADSLEPNLDVSLPGVSLKDEAALPPADELEPAAFPAASAAAFPAARPIIAAEAAGEIAPAEPAGAVAVVKKRGKRREAMAVSGAKSKGSAIEHRNAQRAMVLAVAVSEMLTRYQRKVDMLKNLSAYADTYMRSAYRPGVLPPADQFPPMAARLQQAMEELSHHYAHLAFPLKTSTNGGALDHKIAGGAYRIEKINPSDLGVLRDYSNLSSPLDSTEYQLGLLEGLIRNTLTRAAAAAEAVYREHYMTESETVADQEFVTTVTHPWYRLFLPRKEHGWKETGSHVRKRNKAPFSFSKDSLLEMLREFYESELPTPVASRN